MTDRAEVAVTIESLQASARRMRWERVFACQLVAAGLPRARRELHFAKEVGRAFRFDFAWEEQRVAAEIQGGGWMKPDRHGNRRGAHGGGEALERDCERLSLAAALGWRVVQVTPTQIRTGRAIRWIELALSAERPEGWGRSARRAWAIPGHEEEWGAPALERRP